MTDKRELKSCPFCGGAAEWREDQNPRRPDDPWGLIVNHTDKCYFSLHNGWEEIPTAWNTRPASGDAVEAANLPWTADPDDRPDMEWNIHIFDSKDNRVCFMSNGPNSERNADAIIRAVNATLTTEAPAQTEAMALADDTARLDWLVSESADVRWHSDGDDGILLEIVGHWQAEPREQLLAINSVENLRAAIDEAMKGETLTQPPIAATLRQPASVEAEPVAWQYRENGHPTSIHVLSSQQWGEEGASWIETPLYAHPPADAEPVALFREARESLETGLDYASDLAKGYCTMPSPSLIAMGKEDRDRIQGVIARIDAHLADQVQVVSGVVPVVQADREAAVALIEENLAKSGHSSESILVERWKDSIRNGECDERYEVQSVAKRTALAADTGEG